MTAATDSTRPAPSPRRATRAPMTSRTLSGRAISIEAVLRPPTGPGVLVDGAGLGQVAQHLAHEERVAVGLAVDGVGQAHGRVAEGRGRPRPP